ncbi:hypothetical protein M8Q42_02925 [Enterobacter hormaechei]|uniref:hypothetical protein n=1 Tax=Enterobacter hormaechei TaxID=158836 RepID=UPI000CD2681A|nr:hypothetical protein [Enterobacter hormaechei]PNY63139.1 hypothetical protein C2M14_07215 [Enterobacter cloacae]MCM7201260.1 hypothetical protein [Enterobacter hormaechei]MCO7991334.1 hypothetical protein [Enterobacter hormaechei]MCO8001342.1 hypothetical protein [Enterobacter hormaechei]MCO8014365.1 hypothetical protein [Enterobacter hormaechei]
MTNVSEVEKMAELMQQMEENSPRVAALQYCLDQVAEKVEEAEKRNAELEARCAALAAENAGLKSAIEKHADSYIMCGYCRTERDGKNDDVCEVLDSIPATDAFLAEVRAQGVEMFAKHCQKRHGEMMKSEPNEAASNQAITATRRAGEFALYFAAQLRKGVQL